MKTKKTAKKAVKTRKPKAPKPPFRVLVGRVSKDGKKYIFADKDKKAFDNKTAALQGAHDVLNGDGDDVREVIIIVNPEAQS